MKHLPRLILASESPRRKEILRSLGMSFRSVSISVPEEWVENANPAQTAVRLAIQKVQSCRIQNELILGMDTIVVAGRKKLGKPRNAQEAASMLKLLSNRMHRVVTGVALRYGRLVISDVETTRVYFRKLTTGEIDWYVKTGEPFDKAGAYAIQGLAKLFVKRIEGCYYNVVGFPMDCFQRMLRQSGFSVYDFMR